jgi:hypothetical protein
MKLPTERQLRFGIAVTLGSVVAGVGYYASFNNLRRYAAEHGFSFPAGLPIGMDLGIPALLLLDSLRPNRFLRWSAWTITAATIAGNAAVTPGHDMLSAGLHAILPLIAVVFFEAARRFKRAEDPAEIARKAARKLDRIRWSRYLVAPVRTVRLRARMVAWEMGSYRDALKLESAILYARTVLCAAYGERSWRSTRKLIPISLKHQLDTGQLPDRMLYETDLQGAVREWVLATLDELAPELADPTPEPETFTPVFEPVSAAVERDPWDQVWDRLDHLPPDGLTADQIAIGFALARRNFEQVGKHIAGNRLAGLLGIAKPRGIRLAEALKTGYETGGDRWSEPRSEAATPGPTVPSAQTGPAPAALAGLNGGPVTTIPAP